MSVEDPQRPTVSKCNQCGQNPINHSAHCSIPKCPFRTEEEATFTLRASKIDLSEGAKADMGKVRIDLFPPEALLGISTILTLGAQKYEERNWEKGMKWGRVFGALMRHMWAWWGGKGPTTRNFLFGDLDEETGHSHLWHAGCCIVFLITYEERQIGTDDRQGANKDEN